MEREGFFSKRQFAERLGISLNTLDRWLDAGILPKPAWFGARRYWPVNQVEVVLQRGTDRLRAA